MTGFCIRQASKVLAAAAAPGGAQGWLFFWRGVLIFGAITTVHAPPPRHMQGFLLHLCRRGLVPCVFRHAGLSLWLSSSTSRSSPPPHTPTCCVCAVRMPPQAAWTGLVCWALGCALLPHSSEGPPRGGREVSVAPLSVGHVPGGWVCSFLGVSVYVCGWVCVCGEHAFPLHVVCCS
jgi:hypothetical protein